MTEQLKKLRYWRRFTFIQFVTATVTTSASWLIIEPPNRKLPVACVVPVAFGLSALMRHLLVRRAERHLAARVPVAIARDPRRTS